MQSDLKVVGIEGSYRTHPLPNLPNFKVVPWTDQETIQNADVYVQANILENKFFRKFRPQYEHIRDSGKPYIVVESSVFRRNMPQPPNTKAYHRYSWTSYFRDEGNYNNQNCPPDRWEQIQKDQRIEIKDWRNDGEYILLAMQRPGDSSLKNLMATHKTFDNFIAWTIKEIRKYTDRPIVCRMHPARMDRQRQALAKIDTSGITMSTNMHGSGNLEGGAGLYEDFKNAYAVVGFNSNALTESICEGIPTFSLCPSSMAWECSNKNLNTLEQLEYFDRQQWLNNLGYCQWREDEIARGDPWHHLIKGI
tara:strand:- start:205 stop:1125 length:921 start_codon:yes stop_codon:yes gene_type:complete